MTNKRSIDACALETILAAPMQAVMKADVSTVRQFATYLEEYGFEPPAAPHDTPHPRDGDALARHHAQNHLGGLRMVSFQYQESRPDGAVQPAVVKLPWLSMMPLPLMQVQEADFRFGVRLLNLVDAPPARQRRQSVLRAGAGQPAEAHRGLHWRAALADHATAEAGTGASRHRTVNMEVNVRMRQSDLPAGISQLLALMGSAGGVVRRGPVLDVSAEPRTVRAGAIETIDATVTDAWGEPVGGVAVAAVTSGADASRLRVTPGAGATTDTNGRASFQLRWEPGTRTGRAQLRLSAQVAGNTLASPLIQITTT